MHLRLLTAGSFIVVAALSGCSSAEHLPGRATSPSPVSASDRARQGDIAFAQAMIPHHEQAVQMSELALERTTGDQVRELAEQIKAAQAPEISAMRTWLTTWGVPTPTAGEEMDHASMGHSGTDATGMMTEDDLERLDDSTGAAFDQLWLTMMIEHHEGAVTMAEQVLDTTTDPAVRSLAEAVVRTQQQEIATMRALLVS